MTSQVCTTYPASTTPVQTPKPSDAKRNLAQTLPVFDFKPISPGQWQSGSPLNSAPGTPAPPTDPATKNFNNAILAVLNNTGAALQKLIHNLAQWQQSLNGELLKIEGASFVEDRSQRQTQIITFLVGSGSVVVEQINTVVWVNGLGQKITWLR